MKKNEKTSPDRGFEIYFTARPYYYRYNIDYSTINFDTIKLADKPVIPYHFIQYYDTASHRVTLTVSHDTLGFTANNFMRMFVVTIDGEPIYCGFIWSVIFSMRCDWVFIMEPYYELDSLKENEVIISFSKYQTSDPRNDPRIINRLKADGKIR